MSVLNGPPAGSRRWDVLGIGDVDINVYLQVPHLPGHDEKVLAAELGEFPGGMVANFCCAASLAGARTALVTTVGDDRYGELAAASLADAGVAGDLVTVQPGGRTPYCVVMLDDSGEKALAVVKTGLFGASGANLDPAVLGQARLVHLLANDVEQTTWLARQAKAQGALVSLDIEPTTIGRDPAAFDALLANVDLAFPNAAGLRALSGGEELDGAFDLLRRGPSLVAVTMGAAGCLILSATETIPLPAYRVPVVDTTGAGDCFNGYFAAGVLAGWDLRTCATLATAAAANAVGQLGARNGVPALAAAQQYVAEHPLGDGPGVTE